MEHTPISRKDNATSASTLQPNATTANLAPIENEDQCGLNDNRSCCGTGSLDDRSIPAKSDNDDLCPSAGGGERVDLACFSVKAENAKRDDSEDGGKPSRQLRGNRRGRLTRSASDTPLLQKSRLRETKSKKRGQRGDSSFDDGTSSKPSKQLGGQRRRLARSASDTHVFQKSRSRETKSKKQRQRGDSSFTRSLKSKSCHRSTRSLGNQECTPTNLHDGVEVRKLSIRDSFVIPNDTDRQPSEAPEESDQLDEFLRSMSGHLKESCPFSIRDSVVLPTFGDGGGGGGGSDVSRPPMVSRSKSDPVRLDQGIGLDRPSWIPTGDALRLNPYMEHRMESGLIARQRKKKAPTRRCHSDTKIGESTCGSDGYSLISGKTTHRKDDNRLRSEERRRKSDKKRESKKRGKQHESSSGASRRRVNAASAWQKERKLQRSVSHTTETSNAKDTSTLLEAIV